MQVRGDPSSIREKLWMHMWCEVARRCGLHFGRHWISRRTPCGKSAIKKRDMVAQAVIGERPDNSSSVGDRPGGEIDDDPRIVRNSTALKGRRQRFNRRKFERETPATVVRHGDVAEADFLGSSNVSATEIAIAAHGIAHVQ